MSTRKSNGIGFLVLLWLFASFVTAGGFLLHGKLYWDTGKIFTEFRDQWHSLNVFGEPAWWFPHVQSGMPGYYHSLLGLPSCLNPIFALTAFGVWILGRFGILISQYQPLYVFYFGFLVPLFFLHAVWLLAKRILRHDGVVQYVLILAAFSPGVLFNLSDVGYLEPTIYSLYFASAYWDYVKTRGASSPYPLLLAWAVVVLSFNHGALYWNLFAIPLFGLLTPWPSLRSAFSGISARGWLLVLAVTTIAFAPNAVVLSQGGDLIRSTLGDGLHYPIERLSAGNPLEMLTVGFPGFGFDWDVDRTRWTFMPLSPNYHTAYYYLGLLTLPLLFTGLIWGNRRLRSRLFVFLLLFMGIIPLATYSPFFVGLFLIGPLKSCNHFSDAAFKAGAFLILIFGAGMGLRTLLARRGRRTFAGLFAVLASIAILLQLKLLGPEATGSASFGMLVFCVGAFAVIFAWLLRSKRPMSDGTLRFLILLVLIDVATHSFLWVRNVWNSTLILGSGWPAYHRVDETPAENGLGIRVGLHPHFYSNVLLMRRPYYEMLRERKNPYAFPVTSLHMGESLIAGSVETMRRTYNTWELRVNADKPAFLFLRDGYSPHWKANVNGQAHEVHPALGNYKEVKVPQGSSRVVLRFAPSGVAFSIFLAYALLLGLAAILVAKSLGLLAGNPFHFKGIIRESGFSSD